MSVTEHTSAASRLAFRARFALGRIDWQDVGDTFLTLVALALLSVTAVAAVLV